MLCEAEGKVVVITLDHSSKQLIDAMKRLTDSCLETLGQNIVEQRKPINYERKNVKVELKYPVNKYQNEKNVGLERGKYNFIDEPWGETRVSYRI